jgi:serine/threonine-protein kinase
VDDAIEATEALWRALADRYRVEGVLGRGGMATVFLATDIRHQRRVAIKVLRPEVASALGTARFLREINIASALTHPHLVPLYDSGEAGDRLYYVMPFIQGETLRARLKRERQLSLEDALRITLDVAEGLGYAHQQGVVHRDIKPENILFQSGRAMVADFGIARAIAASATESVTTSGIVIGTAPYMSPEQAAGERELDARSDLYSLGCVLYEMLTGEPPFSGANVQAIIARHIAERAPSISVVRPDLPESVDAMVRRALAKTPADRFATAADFSATVRACSTHRPTRSRRRRRLAALVPVVVLLAAAAILVARNALGGALRDQDWLLVADFDGPSSDPQLATAVRDLVTQSLRQSRYVRLVDRRQLNNLMRNAGIPETTHVDANRARELAVRSSIRAILRGAIRKLDTTTYEVVLHVISVENGNSLASVVHTSTESALPEAVDALSADLRAQLGERHSQLVANRPARVVATPSFAAFRLYSAAADAIVMRGDINTSNALLRQAVRLDTAFAIAWSYLASNYVNARQIDSARVAYAKALAHAERMSVADDYRLKGDVAYALDHDLRAAVKWYDLFLAEVPWSSGRMNRGFYLAALGEFDRALMDFEQAVAQSPFGPDQLQPELNNEAAVLVSLGRLDDARRVTTKLAGPFAQLMEIMIPAAASQWPAAESAAALAVPKSPPGFLRSNAVAAYASALAAQGAVGAADSVLEKEATASTGAPRRVYERLRLLLAMASGRGTTPRATLLSNDTTVAGRVARALLEAASGDSSSARVDLGALATLGARDSVVVGAGPLVVESLIAEKAGNYRRVVDLLGKVAFAGEYDAAITDRPDSFLLRWITASAYEQLGRLDSASVYYELVVRPTRVPPLHYSMRGICYGFAFRHLAAISERRGDRASALRQLDTLLDAFRKPDSTVAPLLVDARRTRARLVAGAALTASTSAGSSPTLQGANNVIRTTRYAVRRIGRHRRDRGV